MSLISDATSTTIQSALHLLDQRLTVLQDNVANVSTPGYIAQRVEFENALSQAVTDGNPTEVTADIVDSADPVDGVGNNVDLGKEMVQLTETALRQQMLVRALNDRYGRITAATEGF